MAKKSQKSSHIPSDPAAKDVLYQQGIEAEKVEEDDRLNLQDELKDQGSE